MITAERILSVLSAIYKEDPQMKKVLFITAAMLLVTLVAGAQSAVYQLNYYSNRNNAAGADQALRVINPGTAGTPLSADEGRICADIYVFDSTQEMIECCSCRITANGLREFSVLNDLTQNPLTGFPAPNSGVIKIIADTNANCNETAPVIATGTNDALEYGLLAWQSHVQQPVLGTFVTTEDEYQAAPLTGPELAFLGQACGFVQYLGSGKGVCKCGTGS